MKASALAVAATLGLSLGAHAQGTYPEKPVRIIVDSAPGSATDVSVRLLRGRCFGSTARRSTTPVVKNRKDGDRVWLYSRARG